ncbi:MAG: hypothetical protein J7M38_05550, partial [Armatimonadetes bacterium]|nr:hypothetical protein [Armatimonadota bacterium]
TLRARTPEGGAEVIVCAPPGGRWSGERVRPLISGDMRLAIVPVPAGESTVTLTLTDAPAAGGELAVTCPEKIAAGGTLSVKLDPAPATALVSVTRNDVPVFAGELPVADGTLTLPVPVQARTGEWQLRVAARVDGHLMSGAALFATEGTFEPELPPYYPPKVGPKREIAEVDVTARGLHVIGAGTDTHDGYDGTQHAEVDAKALTFGGGTIDAPRSRYGYGFGGLEIERARVLTLHVTNTFFDAWTYNRGLESFKPQYTSTFGGLIVDYHTAEGYTKRVALGLGLLNPKRTSDRPAWGTKAAPDQLVTLSDLLHQAAEGTFTIDLARWAPPGWDGRVWLAAGAENVYPARRIRVQIIEAADSPGDREILQGQSLGDLYKLKTYRIARAPQPPTVDGKLDDVAWRSLTPATDFYLLGRSTPCPEATRAWLAYDDTNLYIAFDCRQPDRPPNVGSEKLWGRDAVDVALNPSGDRARFLQIIADADGEFDQFSHSPDNKAFRWEGVQVAAARDEGGWSVEMSVPLAAMGLAPASGRRWAGNFVRYRADREMATWSFMPGPAINDPERFAEFVCE